MNPELSLRARTIGLLERYRLRTQKRLSQHFLIDDEIFQKLSESLKLSDADDILEVGAGPGFLTEAISEHVNHLTAVEIDENYCRILEDRFKDSPNVSIACQNILNFNRFDSTLSKAIGNLPYHLSGSILRWFIDHRKHFSDLYFMLQKEVGERITANPGAKSYGVLSILSQYFTEPKILFHIPAAAFLPPPKVESVFLRMTPKSTDDALAPVFIEVVKRAFSQRRKIILNNFKSWNIFSQDEWNELLKKCDIPPKERSENLPVEAFVALAEQIQKKG